MNCLRSQLYLLVDHISMWMSPWPWTMTHLWIKQVWKVRVFQYKNHLLKGDTDSQIVRFHSIPPKPLNIFFWGGVQLPGISKKTHPTWKSSDFLPFGSEVHLIYFAAPICLDINSIWISLISPLASKSFPYFSMASNPIAHLTSIPHQTTTPPKPPFPTSCCRQCPPQDKACENGLKVLGNQQNSWQNGAKRNDSQEVHCQFGGAYNL